MSILQGSDTLRQAYPKINAKFDTLDAKDNDLQAQINQNKTDIANLQQNKAEQTEIDRLDTRIDNIVAQAGTDNTEIVDARLGADNVARPTLGTLVREIHSEVLNPQYSDTITIEGGIGSIPSNAAEGQISVVVKGNTRTNLVKSSDMNKDSNGDGIVDDFTKSLATGCTFSFSNGQKVALTADGEVYGSGGVTQNIPVNASDIISASVDINFTVTAGSPAGYIRVRFFDANNTQLFDSGYIVDANRTITTTGRKRLKLENLQAPANTAYMRLELLVRRITTADRCEAIFNNAMVEKSSTAGSYISSGTKSTVGASRIKSVGKNLFGATLEDGGILDGSGNNGIVPDRFRTKEFIKTAGNTQYVISAIKAERVYFYDRNKNYIGYEVSPTSFMTPANCRYVRFRFVYSQNPDGLNTQNIQLERNGTATKYEPYKESNAYVIATDKDTGKILELCALPNGTKDEIDVTRGKMIKRVSDWITLDGNESWIVGRISSGWKMDGETVPFFSYDSSIGTTNKQRNGSVYSPDFSCYEAGKAGHITSGDREGFSIGSLDYVAIRIAKSKLTGYSDELSSDEKIALFKQWLSQNPIRLIYQLANPIITQLPAQTLIGYPNGTIYWEPVVKDTAIYNNGVSIADTTLPIKTLLKVIKYDPETKTEIDITSTCTISPDKLSFTSTALSNGDTVIYEYEYDQSLTTIPTLEVTANMNLKAVVNGTSKAVANLNKYVLDLNDFTIATLLNHEMRLTLLEVQ